MNIPQIRTTAVRPTPLPFPLILDRTDAGLDFGRDCADRFECVTADLLNQDETALDGLALAVASLAKNVAETAEGSNFLDLRPDRALLLDQLCDLIDDALGAEAGRIVRAQARIDAQ